MANNFESFYRKQLANNPKITNKEAAKRFRASGGKIDNTVLSTIIRTVKGKDVTKSKSKSTPKKRTAPKVPRKKKKQSTKTTSRITLEEFFRQNPQTKDMPNTQVRKLFRAKGGRGDNAKIDNAKRDAFGIEYNQKKSTKFKHRSYDKIPKHMKKRYITVNERYVYIVEYYLYNDEEGYKKAYMTITSNRKMETKEDVIEALFLNYERFINLFGEKYMQNQVAEDKPFKVVAIDRGIQNAS
ncbi:hypothetical protein [Paenibacillus sp. MER 99-2]|uniref:hypothetical protein n=1 Tax=Paenibacillus sp. MER 99-2 TaxID=2939572 RepID=UPI00203AD62F|nr:hypothetical protein [Paenibacillus sp. MER 99-2]MCM3176219.1 hypothetical protein [Paenibacillus sp. MER 99-2]